MGITGAGSKQAVDDAPEIAGLAGVLEVVADHAHQPHPTVTGGS